MYNNAKTIIDFLQVKKPLLRKGKTFEISIAGAKFFEIENVLRLLLKFVDTATKTTELIVEELPVNSERFYDFVRCLYRVDESSVITVDTEDFENFRGVCDVISEIAPYFQWNDIQLYESALSYSLFVMEESKDLYM